VACFSAHPLTPALRELTDGPVMSILEAPLLYAQTLGSRVGILTTSPRWEPLLTHDVAALHLSAQNAAGVVSSGLSVLDLEDLPRDKVVQRLCDVAREELQDRRGADVIVLGCAGMVGLDVAVRDACQRGMVVLDPVRCALEMCISLIRMDIKTSKIGIYAPA
jgi:allantoin racemase